VKGREVGRKGINMEVKKIWKIDNGWKKVKKETETGEREKGKGWIGRKGDKEGREREERRFRKN
jgi:hypothetical protein